MKFIRGFVPVLILLALAILGLVAYFGYSYLKPKQTATVPTPTVSSEPLAATSPKPVVDETANWKTYTNNYWSITFKYPETLFRGCQNYTTEKEGIRFWGPNFGCESGHDIFYKLGFVGYGPNKYFEPKSPIKSESMTIDGHKALKKYYVYDELDGPASGLKESVEVIINLDKGDIVLQQLGINPQEQKAFDQILSTFKFTN